MKYHLNLSKPSLGIFREDFTHPFNAIISGSSIYKDKPLYKLMVYNDQDDSYDYEDEYVIIYEPTTPSKKSHCFIRIKPQILLENEKAIFYIDSILENYDFDNASISFKITFKETFNSYTGCLITPQNYIEVLERIKQNDEIEELFDMEKPFLLSNFYEKIIKNISKDSLEKVFEKLSKSEHYKEEFIKFNDKSKYREY